MFVLLIIFEAKFVIYFLLSQNSIMILFTNETEKEQFFY